MRPIPGTDEEKLTVVPIDYEGAKLVTAPPAPGVVMMESCFPQSWRAQVSFVTHEYDGTYGAYQGFVDLEECQRCGAWVGSKLKHVAWHMQLASTDDR